jgi:hypothetical protein
LCAVQACKQRWSPSAKVFRQYPFNHPALAGTPPFLRRGVSRTALKKCSGTGMDVPFINLFAKLVGTTVVDPLPGVVGNLA